MYWFNNQFSELTRSILFPGGGPSGGDNYASFNPRSAPDYHSRLPDQPLSGGNAGPRGRGGYGDPGYDEPSARAARGSYGRDDGWRRNWERDQYLREGEDPNRPNPTTAPRSPRPNPTGPEAPRPNLPPILSGPLRLPPIFRPTEPPRSPDAPNPSGPLRLPTLPLPGNPFRRPLGGGGNP